MLFINALWKAADMQSQNSELHTPGDGVPPPIHDGAYRSIASRVAILDDPLGFDPFVWLQLDFA